MIPKDFIHTLLARIDIVAVIDACVPLKKAGANYVACCPFHSEKTPSFSVSPSKQFYHCFGCGAHGTAVGFLIEYGGKSFPDAVEELARDAGLEVPQASNETAGPARGEGEDLAELMLRAARFYRAQLKQSPRAIEYLKQRGLTGEIASRFGIGYAPSAWQGLAPAVPYESKGVETAGLVIASEAGKRYDRFRDRIMFPIHDQSGRVIAFGGRVIDDAEPKYMNSPETPLFSKGRELYGLLQARPAIRRAGVAVVVEGYMDVVALAQHGVEHVVATLGTSTTTAHVQRLLRMTDRVVFCFDGDEAGRRAAWRALENTLPAVSDGKSIGFLFLPDGDDPDDFVRRSGAHAFESLVREATPLSEFFFADLAVRHPPGTAEGAAALAAAARPLLAQLTAPVLGALLRQRLAGLTGLGERELAVALPAPKRTVAPATVRPVRAPVPPIARRLLRTLVHRPSLAGLLDVVPPEGTSAEAGAIEFVRGCAARAGSITSGGLVEQARGTVHAALLEDVAREVAAWDDEFDVNAEFAGAVEKLKRSERNELFRRALQAGTVEQLSAEERIRVKDHRREPEGAREP